MSPPVEKHFQSRSAAPQISPLRCAPVEMTKGRAALPASVVTEQDPFFIALGGPKAHDSSGQVLQRGITARHHTIVIPTGAKRRGGTCGFFPRYSHPFSPVG